MYYCGKCEKKVPWVNIDRSGETVCRTCPGCGSKVELGATGMAFSFHKNVYQKVEEKRGHLPTYRRDAMGKY